MRSPPQNAFVTVGLILSCTFAGFPSEGSAQYAIWSGQGEVFLGRFSPGGTRSEAMGPGGMRGPVKMAPSLLFGGRLLFPVAETPSRHTGKVSLGVKGIAVPGADLELVGASGGAGTADHYELTATVSAGDFLAGNGGLNLRLNGVLGLGVAHTAYHLDPGWDWSEGGESTTSLVLSTGLGADIYLTSWVSLVGQVSWSWRAGEPDHGSVADRSFAFAGGFAFRWPF